MRSKEEGRKLLDKKLSTQTLFVYMQVLDMYLFIVIIFMKYSFGEVDFLPMCYQPTLIPQLYTLLAQDICRHVHLWRDRDIPWEIRLKGGDYNGVE